MKVLISRRRHVAHSANLAACVCAGIAAVKTIMLQAASQRGLLTAERLEAALKDGADLHQAR